MTECICSSLLFARQKLHRRATGAECFSALSRFSFTLTDGDGGKIYSRTSVLGVTRVQRRVMSEVLRLELSEVVHLPHLLMLLLSAPAPLLHHYRLQHQTHHEKSQVVVFDV